MIDLHTHSTASDGSLSPTQLIDEAARRGLAALALTDHDTIDGNEEAAAQAAKRGLAFIPGVELEIAWEPGEFHLLGLGLRHPTEEFRRALQDLARLREERNRQILDRMLELGIEAEYEEVQTLAGGKVVGRPHFAALLVQKGIVKNRQQAFSRYLAKGRPFYVAKGALDLVRAITLIKESGGVAVLAHPLSLYLAWGRLPEAVAGFVALGLDGLEAWHPLARPRSCRRLEELGRRLGILVTAGSDYHGEARADRKLGLTAGDLEIADAYGTGIPGMPGIPGFSAAASTS